MKRRIRILSVMAVLALLGMSFGAVQQTFAQVPPTATVTTGALNVRSGPGVGFNVLTSVYRGTYLTMTARNVEATWVKVITPSGAQGWVSVPFIATAYPIVNLPVEGQGGVTGATATVNTGALNVRSGPGVGFGVLASYFRGTVLTMIARNAEATWVKVIAPTAVQGWVSVPFIATSYPIVSLPVEGGTTTPPPTTGYRTHVVQPGENLFRISLNYGVNMYDVARLNGIINLALIYAGQTLLIP
ncbi:MAG TPA: SH3 domain-containing protein [Aggregatilineaceae bacterium]|nr:SH3 domain-containing protein [Aggregatilineaceae bacterium]